MPRLKLEIEKPAMCVEFDDPKNPEVKHVETLLPFYEIKKLKKGNANVRPPKEDRRPFKAMMETIETKPDEFHVKNRGITYICTNVEYDRKDKVLVIDVPEEDTVRKGQKEDVTLRYGIADGGHTFEAITRTVAQEKDYQAMEKWSMPFGRVHFIATRDLRNVEPIVEALNTSTQVQDVTLDEYQNKFASMKQALRDQGFDLDHVAFREGEDKEWKIENMLQTAACFLPERWQHHQPTNMYKSKNKSRRLFTDEDTRHEFKEIYPVLKDVLTLPDLIQSRFSELTEDQFNGKKALPMGTKKLREPYTRTNTEYPTNYRFNSSVLLPLAAAFRILLKKDQSTDTYMWGLSYKKILDLCVGELYELYLKAARTNETVSQVGSNYKYWSSAINIVEEAKRQLVGSSPIVRKKERDDESKDQEKPSKWTKSEEEEALAED